MSLSPYGALYIEYSDNKGRFRVRARCRPIGFEPIDDLVAEMRAWAVRVYDLEENEEVVVRLGQVRSLESRYGEFPEETVAPGGQELAPDPYKDHSIATFLDALSSLKSSVRTLAHDRGLDRMRAAGNMKRAVDFIEAMHKDTNPVVQDWVFKLPMQQQSVLLIGLRGPDGTEKETPFKRIVRAYRASVVKAAYYGRPLAFAEGADTFMGLDRFADPEQWKQDIDGCKDAFDSMNIHYFTHLMYGAQILGYKHPKEAYRMRWHQFYLACCTQMMHLQPETEEQMDARLCDWGRKHWGDNDVVKACNKNRRD